MIKKILNWFKQSNRDKHLKVGFVAIIALLIFGGALGLKPIPNFINANIIVFLLMAAVEYKDKLYGNKFDWYDIIAGIIPAIAMDILYILTLIFN